MKDSLQFGRRSDMWSHANCGQQHGLGINI